MQNWSGDENAIMKGYVLRAINTMNRDTQEDNGHDAINDELRDMLFSYLRMATDDMTADEAYKYYQTH